jgi:hypothetical protein
VETVDGAIVYKARNSIEARALAAYLENADISAHVAGEVMENIFGVQNIGDTSGSEVWVNSADRPAAEELIELWQKEFGGPGAARPDERLQFPLKTVFAVMAIVALVAATSRLFGADFRGFISAASIWFWILLIAASMWAVFFKKSSVDREDVGPTRR